MPLPAIPAVARSLALHPGYALAAGAALLAVAALAAATLLLRKRVRWSACLDVPVAVTAGEPAPAGTRPGRALLLGNAVAGPCPPGAERAWLVVVDIANRGLTPVRGSDFRVPLSFTFPGRQVQAAQLSPRWPARRAVLPAVPPAGPRREAAWPGPGLAGSHRSCIQLSGDLLLRPGGRCSVMVVLTGDESLGMAQGGEVRGGTISRDPGDW